MIANSGHDENGKYTNGKAGDQTGSEWQVRTWYSRPWNCVLRHPDRTVGIKHAELAREAAQNDHIGYDKGQRWTFLSALRLANWRPAAIKTDCEEDCSSGVISLTMAVGNILGLSALKTITQQASYTGNMRKAYAAAGFLVLTESKYLTSDEYLLPGDILLNDTYHTAINLDTGSKATQAFVAYAARVNVNTHLNVRSGPGTSYDIVQLNKKDLALPPGLIVTIIEEANGWGRLSDIQGWVSLSYLSRSSS